MIDENLDCAFVENALFLHRSIIAKSQQNIIELVTRPARHEGVEERVGLEEDVWLDEVDGGDVLADHMGQGNFPDLVQLLLGEAGGRDVVLVPIPEKNTG